MTIGPGGAALAFLAFTVGTCIGVLIGYTLHQIYHR